MTEPHRPWEVFGTTDYTAEQLEVLSNMPLISGRHIKIETTLAEPPDFNCSETVTLTRDEIIAQKQAILDRYGLAEKDMTAAECGCCPDGNYIPWVAFRGWRTLNWLLGGEA